MKSIILLPIFLALLLLGMMAPREAKGQIFLDVVQGSLTGIPDTVDMGDTIDFAYQMVNQGPLPFIGIQYTNLTVNGSSLPFTIDSSLISLLGVGDTTLILVPNYTFTTARHQGGGNVMVIWPTGSGGGQQTDSLRQDVYVREPVAIQPAAGSQATGVYPNPTRHNIRLRLAGESNPAKFAEIRTLEGKTLYTQTLTSDQETEIPTNLLSPGVYLLYIQFRNGTSKYIQIIRL